MRSLFSIEPRHYGAAPGALIQRVTSRKLRILGALDAFWGGHALSAIIINIIQDAKLKNETNHSRHGHVERPVHPMG
jgi:hypothetical protein